MANDSPWLLYGASGFTGQLIAEEAKARGHAPILAGRSEEKVRPLAERLGLPWKAFPLDDPGSLRHALEGVPLVLHAAGPFTWTSAPMVRACIDVGAHYTDITGELHVFQRIFAQDDEATRRGVCLMPGIGFDVVPTDCMAVHVASRVKHPRKLEIAIAAIGTPTGGTSRSVVEILPGGIRVRRKNGIRSRPPFKGARRVRFPEREASVVPAPLADLETAFHSTGIEDITTYVAVPSRLAKLGHALWPVAAVTMPIAQAALKIDAVRNYLGEAARKRAKGPTEAQRQTDRSFVWVRAEGDDGAAESVLTTLDGYEFTKLAAVRVVEKILKDNPRGAKSPAQVVGADFVLELPKTLREDR